jgi:hypothetical protein
MENTTIPPPSLPVGLPISGKIQGAEDLSFQRTIETSPDGQITLSEEIINTKTNEKTVFTHPLKVTDRLKENDKQKHAEKMTQEEEEIIRRTFEIDEEYAKECFHKKRVITLPPPYIIHISFPAKGQGPAVIKKIYPEKTGPSTEAKLSARPQVEAPAIPTEKFITSFFQDKPLAPDAAQGEEILQHARNMEALVKNNEELSTLFYKSWKEHFYCDFPHFLDQGKLVVAFFQDLEQRYPGDGLCGANPTTQSEILEGVKQIIETIKNSPDLQGVLQQKWKDHFFRPYPNFLDYENYQAFQKFQGEYGQQNPEDFSDPNCPSVRGLTARIEQLQSKFKYPEERLVYREFICATRDRLLTQPIVQTDTTAAKPNVGPSEEPLAELVTRYLKTESTKWPEFQTSPEVLTHVCADYYAKIGKMAIQKYDVVNDFGYVEKLDLQPGNRLFTRADIHGDLKSLLEDFKIFQSQGLLDENYRATPGSHLVFLGDYVDRGSQSMEVLELLMRLKIENPNNVHLIRGNHEDADYNRQYEKDSSARDERFSNFLGINSSEDAQKIQQRTQQLKNFYNSLPLAYYISGGPVAPDKPEKQYIQYSHGALEPTVDLEPLLDHENTSMTMSQVRALSQRVEAVKTYQGSLDQYKKDLKAARKAVGQARAQKNEALLQKSKFELQQLKLQFSAKVIKDLWEEWRKNPELDSTYLWGDFTRADAPEKTSKLGPIASRSWKLSPRDAKHYFRLATNKNPVLMIFRGHQHFSRRIETGRKFIGETLSISAGGYKSKAGEISYIFTVAPLAKDWKKTPIVREPGGEACVGKQMAIQAEPDLPAEWKE